MSDISDAMRAARKRCGFSQRMLERKSGVSISTLRHYETGKSMPGLYNLIAITDALGISIDEYIGRKVRRWKNEVVIEIEEEKQSTEIP